MKLKHFRKLTHGLPLDTKMMLVLNWIDVRDGKLQLMAANAVRMESQEPQFNEDAVYYVLYHDPDSEGDGTLRDLKKLFRGRESELEVLIEDENYRTGEEKVPLLSANCIGRQLDENDEHHVYFIYHDPDKEYEAEQKRKKEIERQFGIKY